MLLINKKYLINTVVLSVLFFVSFSFLLLPDYSLAETFDGGTSGSASSSNNLNETFIPIGVFPLRDTINSLNTNTNSLVEPTIIKTNSGTNNSGSVVNNNLNLIDNSNLAPVSNSYGPRISNIKTGLVPCGNPDQSPCDFKFFILMINNIINWIISMAGVIFTISAIYGGFLYMTSGDNPANKGKAVSILWNTLKGFVIILTSWLIVYTILHTLVDPKQQDSVFRFIGNGD